MRRGVDPAFSQEAFCYDAVTDTYSCPAGKVLRHEGEERHMGRTDYKYRSVHRVISEPLFRLKKSPNFSFF